MRPSTRARFVSAAAGIAVAASFFATAPFVHAAALTAAQIDSITNLLQAFGADQATIANVQAALQGTTPSAAPASAVTGSTSSGNTAISASGSNCAVNLSGDLKVGSTGTEVEQLQAFLAKDKTIYPSGSVTGYFGPMTEEAVQRWQESHQIVSSGTPNTTGYGMVGPRTRSELGTEMEKECGDANSSDSSIASSTSQESGSDSSTASSTSSGN